MSKMVVLNTISFTHIFLFGEVGCSELLGLDYDPPPFGLTLIGLPLIGLPPIGLHPFGLTSFGLRGHLDLPQLGVNEFKGRVPQFFFILSLDPLGIISGGINVETARLDQKSVQN